MKAVLGSGSGRVCQEGPAGDETKPAVRRCLIQETQAMLIYVLAVAMTFAMLIATFVALHQEADRMRLAERTVRVRGFGDVRRHSR
jgi:heme/copper-type cytochrome/quinol oxidase subunit 3